MTPLVGKCEDFAAGNPFDHAIFDPHIGTRQHIEWDASMLQCLPQLVGQITDVISAVISVILRIPSASKMLFGSKLDLGDVAR